MSQADYRNARWYGAHGSNYSDANRPGSSPVNKIVIHITEGSFSSAINWFNDSRANVSAHYVVRSDDGFIGQCVHEEDIAWHSGDWPTNQTSIGIEHEGYSDDSKWLTSKLYVSSARLSAYLCKKYDIPIDRDHFIAHREVSSTVCPGRYWDWDKYLSLVRRISRYAQVVDNSSPRFTAPGSWRTSSYSDQKFRENYRYTSPQAVNEPARFKFNLPENGEYEVFARWPASPGYNGRTRFQIKTSGGWVTRVRDQTKNGGRWVKLGTFSMDAGVDWKVNVDRRSPVKGYIIADAVMIREA